MRDKSAKASLSEPGGGGIRFFGSGPYRILVLF
jgi:hypothetical protein